MESLVASLIIALQVAVLGAVAAVWRKLACVEGKLERHLGYHQGQEAAEEQQAARAS